MRRLPLAFVALLLVGAPAHAFLLHLAGGGPMSQTMSAPALSSSTFQPNTPNGIVGTITVAMTPAIPASTARITLTGANSGGFQLSGSGCSNLSLGTCTLEQSVGGTAPGTYTDVTISATQAGAIGSPTQTTPTLSGQSQTVSSIGLSQTSFPSGSSPGTIIAAISTVLSPASPSYGGSYTIVSSGTDHTGMTSCASTNGANFQIIGSNLEVLASNLTAPSYQGVCIQAGGSGGIPAYVQAFTLTTTASGAGFSLVEKAASSGCASPGTTCSVTLPATKAGDLIVVGLSYCNGAGCGVLNPNGVPISISDSHGNTCALIQNTLVGSTDNNVPATGIGYCQGNKTAGSDTITVTWSNPAVYYLGLYASEWSGGIINAPLDSSFGAISASPPSGISISTTSSTSNDLVYSIAFVTGGGSQTPNQTGLNGPDEYQIAGASGSQTNSWGSAGGAGYAASIATFSPQSAVEIASATPSTMDFTANVPNGIVGVVTANMAPPSQTFAGSMAIIGTNSGGFHLANCAGNSCDIEQASGGGTPAGTYTDFDVVASQGGIANSPASFAMTAIGATPPADTMTVQDASGAGASNYPFQVGHPFIPAEIPAGTCVQATYAGSPIETQTDITNDWPDGSIKFAVISAVLPAIPAGSPGVAQTISFAPTTSGSRTTNHCYAVSGVAADSDPLSIAAMEGPAYNFDSNITFVGNPPDSKSTTVSALTMLNAASAGGGCVAADPWSSQAICKTYYYGPVMQEIGLWDGRQTTTCAGTANVASTYDVNFGNGDNYCPVRPMFEATFWEPTHQVWMRFVAMSGLLAAYEDAKYVVTITAGKTSPTTVFGPFDLSGTGNATGEGQTGISAAQTVNSSYSGTLAISGTVTAPPTPGSTTYWYDTNTGEWFEAIYNSSSQLNLAGPSGGCNNNRSGCRGIFGMGPSTITSGDPLTETFPVKEHWAATAWTERYWLGTTPNQEININHNLAYLDWTHFIPNYDTTATLSPSTIEGSGCAAGGNSAAHGYVGWWTGCSHQPYDGWWDGGVIANGSEAVGGRPEIAPNPAWDAWWLSSGDWRMQIASMGLADLQSSFAFHLIGTSPNDRILRYDTPGDGTGLPVTLQGHGGIYGYSGHWPDETQGAYPNDGPTPIGNLNELSPWFYEIMLSHAASEFYVPYVMTGDPWLLQEMGSWNTWSASSGSIPPKLSNGPSETSGPLDNLNNPSYRGDTFETAQSRAQGWDYRNRAQVANIWPDNDPQQTYFIALMNDGLASIAGSSQLGSSSPYFNTIMYNWGSTNGADGNCSAAGFTVPAPTYMGSAGCSPGAISVGDCNAQGAGSQEAFYNFFADDGAGNAEDVGFPSELTELYSNWMSGLMSSAYPKLYVNYQPDVTDNSNTFFPTLAAWVNNVESAPLGTAFLTNNPNYVASGGTCLNLAGSPLALPDFFTATLTPSGYAVQGQMGLAEAVDAGSASAATAWNGWYKANVYDALEGAGTGGYSWNQDMSFDIVPRPVGNRVIPPPNGWSPSLQ